MADLRAQLETGLASRYTVERELGRGGMATVYLAHDLRHDRPVALKVLHPELSHAVGPERFQREIRLAARLQHPHILTVLDSGEVAAEGAGTLLYFTMPYVEGESLRGRLDREKQLPLDDALRITREAAQALQYAHDHGVIHRDIKPENILLTSDGSTLVADFGIARTLSGGSAKLTETGMAVGTPAYMSPEQASGEQDLTARTDVYSLGAVLYEMLAGEAPFTGPTPQAIIARRFSGEVPDVRRSRSTVPEPVGAAIARALALVPADRWSSAAEFARAVSTPGSPTLVTSSAASAPAPASSAASPARGRRRIPPAFAMLGLGFVIGLGLLFAWRRGHSPEAAAGTRLIAVLPFENLGDSSDAYFADGITDEVRNKLAGVPGVEVIARGSSTPYKGSRLTPARIADELGVRYLLTGTVRRVKTASGDQVLVRPELVEVADGQAPRTKWGESMDASLTDVFKVQADIAAQVAQALDVAFGAEARQQVAERPTSHLAAYDAYLRGEAISNGMSVSDPGTLRQAVTHYEQATALDPTFAVAWSRLSQAQSLAYTNGTPTPAGAAAALHGAERALALAPDRPDGYLAMGGYFRSVLLDPVRAAAQYETGLRLAPANADLLAAAGANGQATGQWDSSLVFLRRAAELDPRSSITARRLARIFLWLRRYDEAETAHVRARALAPTNLAVIEGHAMVSLARGDLAGARAVLASAPKEVPPTDLVAAVGNFWDLFWLLDEPQTELLLRLGPASFDNDRAIRALVFMQTYRHRGDALRTTAHADTAVRELDKQLAATPNDAQRHVLRGLALAYLGRKAEAIEEGRRGTTLVPISRDGFNGPYYQHQLARIYLAVGEPEKALDQLEPLLRIPYYLSPGWLRIDPDFRPLKGNPRFERLIGGRT